MGGGIGSGGCGYSYVFTQPFLKPSAGETAEEGVDEIVVLEMASLKVLPLVFTKLCELPHLSSGLFWIGGLAGETSYHEFAWLESVQNFSDDFFVGICWYICFETDVGAFWFRGNVNRHVASVFVYSIHRIATRIEKEVIYNHIWYDLINS